MEFSKRSEILISYFWEILSYEFVCGGAPALECDFNKAARRSCWSFTLALVFSCGFGGIFRGMFSWKHLWRAASAYGILSLCLSLSLYIYIYIYLSQRI